MRWGGTWRSTSGVCGIDDGFVWGGPSSVPAAGATLLPDAGIVLALVAGEAEIGGHVGPDTLVLGAHDARRVVAGLDLQLGKSHRLADSATVDPGLMPAPPGAGLLRTRDHGRGRNPATRGPWAKRTYSWLTLPEHLLCARHSAKGRATLFSFTLVASVSPFYP